MKNKGKTTLHKHTDIKSADITNSDFSKPDNETILSLIIVFCFPVLLYIQTLTFGLVNFDDDSLITDKISFLSDFHNARQVFLTDAFLDKSSHFYRPLQSLSYMIDIQISGGNNAWMYHLTNILFLGLISSLLFVLLRKLMIPSRLAVLSSLLYCSHPLFISNVAWIPARGDLQLMFFSLMTFLFFIEFIRSKKLIYMFLQWIAFTLALFSKETAAFLPLLLIVYYFTFQRERRFEKIYFLNIGLIIISEIFWFWIRLKAIGDFSNQNEVLNVLSKNNEVGFMPFIRNLQTVPESLANFFIPFDIDALPTFSVLKTVIGLVLAILMGILFYKNHQSTRKEKLFAILWFILLLLPTMLFKSNFIDYLNHRLFLPMTGILLYTLYVFPKNWFKADTVKNSWIMIAVIFVLSSFTIVKSRSYSDPMTFYSSAISQNPNSDFAYIHRGYLYETRGRYDKAMDDFTSAIKINPDYAQAYNNRGIVNAYQGLYKEAIADYSKALELDPGIIEAYNNRGLAYGYLGFHEKAIDDYSKVIELKPDVAEAYNNRGMAYGNLGLYNEAITNFTKAISLKPDYAQAYDNRGIAYYRQGILDKACPDFKKAAELGLEDAKINASRFCQ
jgi:tetratricopeptide (TPR) repeat protein